MDEKVIKKQEENKRKYKSFKRTHNTYIRMKSTKEN